MTAIRTVDYHTGGEPFRIVTGGVEPLEGATMLERRRDALERLDHVRRLLVNEPRGHADMYGCHVVPGNDAGADLGVVFFHNAGYSTACGHGTIALVTWALDEGIVERREGENRVVVDVPSGRLETVADVRDGRVRSVTFRNVPSFVWGTDVRGRRGRRRRRVRRRVLRDVAERVEPAELPRLIELGRELKRDLEAQHEIVHPLEPELRDVYGVIFWQPEGGCAADPAQRDGVRRRRGRPLAVRLRHLGAARPPRRLRRSAPRGRAPPPVDRRLRASSVASSTRRTSPAARPSSPRSRALRTAPVRSTFTLDPDDPLGEGFLLR